MTTQTASLALLRPFFGTTRDQRGETFTHLNYNGSAYGVALNPTGTDVNAILSQPVYQLLLSDNYKNHNSANDNYIHESLIDLIVNTAQFHRLVDTGAAANGITGNEHAQFLINFIYKFWPQLTQEVRSFYMTHLQILVKNGATWKKPLVENGIEIAADLDPSNIRLNLTKVNPADSNSAILFASTLPRIPANIVGIKFTGIDATGKETVFAQPFTGTTASPTLLEEIYTTVYKTGTMTVAGTAYPVPPFESFDDNAYPNFDLNVNTFLKNTISAGSAPAVAAAPKAVSPREASFDDIYESMVTGVTYVRDDSGKLFKHENGKKIEYNEAEALANAETCYGTGVKDADCLTVFNCLLSGNPSSLARCLGKFANQDMFKVGQSEVEQMPPSVAVQLLKTFGFKPRKELPSMNILPPTFDEWSKNILPNQVTPATAEAIKNNKPLMEYLKGVVSFVRSNPSIISGNKGERREVSDYSRHANISVFRQPSSGPARSTLNASILDLGVLSSTPSINSLPLAALLGNVDARSMMMLPGMQMGGGVNPACVNARALSQMFKVTYSEMERNGKQLVDSDKNRINDAVNKVAQLEEKLMKIVRDLKTFNKLHSALSVKQGPIGIEDITLAEIHNSNQNSVTGEAVNNLTNCASQNITELNKLIGDLIGRVQRPLVSEVLGGQTGGSMIEIA